MSDELGGPWSAASSHVRPTVLELTGIDTDGEHLLVRGPDQTTFRLRLTDELRAAVRGDRAGLEALQSASEVSPREIQSRIRAGESAEDIAAQSGLSLEQIRRYEGPVLAEREYVAQQARGARLGASSDAPTLGDLVTDRLAARHVEVYDLEWDAARSATGQWNVSVGFLVGTEHKIARWSFDLRSHSVRALEDEARWLSETEIPDEPIPGRRHLSAVRDEPFDFDSVERTASPPADPVTGSAVRPATPEPPLSSAASEELLDDLARRRGVRQHIEIPGEDDDQWADDGALWGSGNAAVSAPGASPDRPDVPAPTTARVYSLAAAREDEAAPDEPTGRKPIESSPEQDAPPQASPVTDEAPPVPKARSGKRGRSQMPSWDEIVFGAKPE